MKGSGAVGFVLGALCATAAWCVGVVACSVLWLAVFALCMTRWQACCAATGYFAIVAARVGKAAYDYGLGYQAAVGATLAGAAVPVAIYSAAWAKARGRRAMGLVFSLILTTVPPFGVVGWGHPLIGVGEWLPGTGWLGLATVSIAAATASALARWRSAIGCLLLLGSVIALPSPRNTQTDQWRAINTAFRENRSDLLRDYNTQNSLWGAAQTYPNEAVLVPEGGLLDGGAMTLVAWSSASRRRWVVGGASVPAVGRQAEAALPDEVLVAFRDGQAHLLYRQRQPVPWVRWRPGWKSSATADWWSDPTFFIDGRRVAGLICYETFLLWPAASSFSRAEEVLQVSDLEWSDSGGLVHLQWQILRAWSSLFGIPFESAVNVRRTL